MNIISKIHQNFSEFLVNPRVLTNSEEFLGPNYEEVLNFWLILDELTKNQLRVVKDRHDAFFDETQSEWHKTRDLAWEASKKVVGWKYAYGAGWAARDFTNSWAVFYATRELIGMHLILEQQPLTFLPMVLEVL